MAPPIGAVAAGPRRRRPLLWLPSLFAAVVVASLGVVVDGTGTRLQRKNPVSRVLKLLHMLEQKVQEEGKKEKEEFDRFMCDCKTNSAKLAKSIADAETRLPNLESDLKEGAAEAKRLVGARQQAKADLVAAKAALKNGKELRTKEANNFAKETAESEANIKAMASAIKALKGGKGGSFLQSSAAERLRSLTLSQRMSDVSRDVLSSFLSRSSSASSADEDDEADDRAYSPGTGEIVGLLAQMKETMEQELVEARAAEKKAQAAFESMSKAKAKEIDTLVLTDESIASRAGVLAENLVNQRNQFDDTKKGLEKDRKFKSTLKVECDDRKKAHEIDDKSRSQELIALSETIGILNDDASKELLKKTLPGPSFLEVQVTDQEVRQEALQVLRADRLKRKKGDGSDPRLDLLALALRAKKVSFDKVLDMLDQMVVKLGKEQGQDDKKKGFCRSEFATTQSQKKKLTGEASDLKKVLADGMQRMKASTEEIKALAAGLQDLDRMVAEATRRRQEENALFKDNLATNGAAKDLLGKAKDRLRTFYNPKLAKGASALQEQSVDMDEEADPKTEESNGILAMIGSLQATLDKQIQTMKVEEQQAQKEYETALKESATKRATDAKSIANLEGIKATAEAEVHKWKKQLKSKVKEVEANADYSAKLHADCDWLLSNFGLRKERRAQEIESLKRAKAVLSGADYSFVQIQRSRRLRASSFK